LIHFLSPFSNFLNYSTFILKNQVTTEEF
jgi:hypothetical protein